MQRYYDVGEKFEYKRDKLKVVEANDCIDCNFNKERDCKYEIEFLCGRGERKDQKSVKFIKVKEGLKMINGINELINNSTIEETLFIAVEELSELQKEITKLASGKGSIEKMIEEIADVCIIIDTLKYLYKFSDIDIQSEIETKMERNLDRIERRKYLKQFKSVLTNFNILDEESTVKMIKNIDKEISN